MADAAHGKLDGGHSEARTTIDAEERIGALTDYIRFRVTEQLIVKLKTRRLSQAVSDISTYPNMMRLEAIRRRGPHIRLPVAAMLSLLDRLSKQQKAIGIARCLAKIMQVSSASKVREATGLEVDRRVEAFVVRIQMAEKILTLRKNTNLGRAFSKILQQGVSSCWQACMREQSSIGLLKISAVFCKKAIRLRQSWLFSALSQNLIHQSKSKINDIFKDLAFHKSTMEKLRLELNSSESLTFTLKADLNKFKSQIATTNLEVQRNQAKVNVLETENTALMSRYDDLSGKFEQLRDERDRLGDTVDRLRREYYNLQQDYEDRIDNFSKTTDDVSQAAAKTSMERAALAEKLKAMVEQREEDKQWLNRIEQEKREIGQRVTQQEMINGGLMKQNGELKEKLSETINSLVMMKDEHLRLRKESEDRTWIIEKLNKDVE